MMSIDAVVIRLLGVAIWTVSLAGVALLGVRVLAAISVIENATKISYKSRTLTFARGVIISACFAAVTLVVVLTAFVDKVSWP